uniref:Uncharacterized protein n=1 Tax=Dulem virus 235 TaxID=3145712 RepID=A0AAU8B4D6_9VIRU
MAYDRLIYLLCIVVVVVLFGCLVVYLYVCVVFFPCGSRWYFSSNLPLGINMKNTQNYLLCVYGIVLLLS